VRKFKFCVSPLVSLYARWWSWFDR